MATNVERLIQLAEEFFETKNDPDQISVTPDVMDRLRGIHPACLSDYDEGEGPVVWVLVIPTTRSLMERFIAKDLTEQELLDTTPVMAGYDAIYLCSALVLPEYRRRGLAREVTVAAVRSIQADHPIRSLFYWAFSEEGRALATSVAQLCSLPLYQRPE